VSLIAQAALETDWGRSTPRTPSGASSNNLFGIKASGGWSGPSVRIGTQEYVNGAATATQARFRAYGSCGQCFQDYTALLSGDPRYAAALGTGNDVGAFASALQQAGYATDPNYARKLTAVADTLSRTLASRGAPGPLKLADAGPITAGSSAL
jgi:flagellar protein FlgJ